MKKSIFILVAVMAMIGGCKKDNNDGNAVMQSNIYDATSADWATSDHDSSWYTGLVVPEITQSVMNSGAVMVYIVDTTGGGYYNFQVPYYYGLAGVNVTATIYAGNVQI